MSNQESSLVHRICEELWNCQDPVPVLNLLQGMQHVLRQELPTKYDASEAFLAIQGAALRFLPSTTTNTGSLDGEDDDSGNNTLPWSITEEALRAAATLCGVCIGPAWHAQMKYRRRFSREEDEQQQHEHANMPFRIDPPEDIIADDYRSYSPLTEHQSEEDGTMYQRIPEVLPAAVLRHASSLLRFLPETDTDTSTQIWKQRKARIAKTQRFLVLTLCCEDFEKSKYERIANDGVSRRWTIPGVHELVGEMVLFWLRLAVDSLKVLPVPAEATTLTEKPLSNNDVDPDLRAVLAASRATVDLISTGWRPIRPLMGPAICEALLHIANYGLCTLDSLWNNDKLSENTRLQWEKETCFIVLSSSAETISALTVMASRSLIPHESENELTNSICRLHVRTRLVKVKLMERDHVSELHPPFSSKERQEFLNQLDSCFADSWDLLVSLCSKTSCTGPMDVLLDIIAESNPSSDLCQEFLVNPWGMQKTFACLAGGTALRVLSTAMWETDRGVDMPSHLRLCMVTHIGTLNDLAVAIHKILHVRITDGSFQAESTPDLLALALDTVVSFETFVNQQIAGGGRLVSTVEWDLLLTAIEETLLSWFEYYPLVATFNNESVKSTCALRIINTLKRSQIEVQSLILRLGAMLDKFTREDNSPFHSLVAYDSQERFYKFILTKVIQLIDPTDGELLGLSVSRSWVKFGLFPFRLCGWFETASEILGTMFLRQGDNRYIFSANVRLATLAALEQSYRHVSMTTTGLGQNSTGRHIEKLVESNDYQSHILKAMIDVVGMCLKDFLSDQHVNQSDDSTCPLDDLHGQQNYQLVAYGGKQESFDSHIVTLAGILVRDGSIHRDQRVSILNLLQMLASKPYVTHPQFQQSFQVEIAIRLEIVRELEKCLEKSFAFCAVDAWIIPLLLGAFVAILTGLRLDDYKNDAGNNSTAVRTYALLVLARIRPTNIQGRIKLLCWKTAFAGFHDDIKVKIALLLHLGGRHHRKSAGDPSLSFLKQGQITTAVLDFSLDEIIQSVMSTLDVIRLEAPNLVGGPLDDLRFVVLICFHCLSSLWLDRVGLGDEDTRSRFLAACDQISGENQELVRMRSIAFSTFFQSRMVALESDQCRQHSLREDRQDLTTMLEILLKAFGGNGMKSELIIMSRTTLAVMPLISLLSEGAQVLIKLFRHITMLPISREKADNTDSEEAYPLALAVANEILLVQSTTIPMADQVKFFEKCYLLVNTHDLDRTPTIFHIAVRCIITTTEMLARSHIRRRINNLVHVDAPTEYADGSDKSAIQGCEFIDCLVREVHDQLGKPSPTLVSSGFPSRDNTFLDDLAIEADEIAQFEVERDERIGAEVSSTWFDSNCQLVTLRLGSSRSLFRGWVEVTIRSVSRRTRQLIRLPSRVSLRNPHRPSKLWFQQPVETTSPSENSTEPPPKASVDLKTASLLKQYDTLLSRFNHLITTTPSTEAHALLVDSEPPPVGNAVLGVDVEIDLRQDNPVASLEVADRDIFISENLTQWLLRTLGNEECMNVVMAAVQEMGLTTPSTKCLETFLKQLQPGQKTDRSVTVLDRISPCNTHKIGLLYLDDGQMGLCNAESEARLLSNEHCSPAFHRFADRLGSMISTRNLRFFSGGLDVFRDSDGHFTRAWVDTAPQGSTLQVTRTIVVFHVPCLMPPGVINRKRHIGNDNVIIVFQDSQHTGHVGFDSDDASQHGSTDSLVSGHFGFVTIHVVEHSKDEMTRVSVRVRQDIQHELYRALVPFAGTTMVTLENTPAFVRRIAILADLACRAILENLAPATNSYERYKMLKQMGRHIQR